MFFVNFLSFFQPPLPSLRKLLLKIFFSKKNVGRPLDGEAESRVFVAEQCDSRLVCVESVVPPPCATELVLAHEPYYEEYLRVSIAGKYRFERGMRERTVTTTIAT